MNEEKLSELFKQVQNGDDDAVSALVSAYHSRAKEMAKIYAPEGSDTRKIEIQAFSKTLRSLDEITNSDEFEETLYTNIRKEALKFDTASIPAFTSTPTVEETEVQPDALPSNMPDIPAVPVNNDEYETEELQAPEPIRPKSAVVEEEEMEQPVRRTSKVTYEEEDDEEEEAPRRKSKKSRYEEDEDEDEYEEEKPRRKKTKYVEEDDDDDDDYEDDEPRGFATPILVILIIIALLAIVILGLYNFAPKVYNSLAQSFNSVLPIDLPLNESVSVDTDEVEDEIVVTAEPTAEAEETAEAAEETTDAEVEETEEPTQLDGDSAPLETAASSVIGTVTVNITNLNIRSSASTSGEKVGTAEQRSYDVYETATADGYTWYRIGDNQWIAGSSDWVTFTQG